MVLWLLFQGKLFCLFVLFCFSGETSLPAFHPVVVLLTDSGGNCDLWCIKGSVEMIDCQLTPKESSLHSWKHTEQRHSSSSSKDDARGRRGGDLVWSGRTAWQWKKVVMGLGLGSTLYQDPGPVSLLLCSCEWAYYIYTNNIVTILIFIAITTSRGVSDICNFTVQSSDFSETTLILEKKKKEEERGEK